MDSNNGEAASIGGSCFCGRITFEIDLPTRFCSHCHCSMCRRAHGAGYVTWIGVPLTQFRFLSGREHLKAFQSSDRGRRSFCQECGSTLFCESSHYPDMMDIVLANMDGPIDRKPKAHYYYSDRADWVSAEDDLPRFGGQTGTEPLPHHH